MITIYHNARFSLSIAALPLMMSLVACGTAPSKTYVDGKWRVNENVCSSDPSKPDQGDMSSQFRLNKDAVNNIFLRNAKFNYGKKTIVSVSQQVGVDEETIVIKRFKNSSANGLISTKKVADNDEMNASIKRAIEAFFSNDPNIDGKQASSLCLFRGNQ